MLVCIIELVLRPIHSQIDTTFLGKLVSRIDLGGVEPQKVDVMSITPLTHLQKNKNKTKQSKTKIKWLLLWIKGYSQIFQNEGKQWQMLLIQNTTNDWMKSWLFLFYTGNQQSCL